MNDRERFHATMHYLPRDRAPMMDFGFWDETRAIWCEQGLPAGVDTNLFFGMDAQWIGAPIKAHLCPTFPFTVLQDLGETQRVRDEEGVTKVQGKFLGSIPRHIDHTLTDRASWEAHFKWRLNGSASERYPAEWPTIAAHFNDPARDYPLGIDVGSLYGWIRNWMGLEAVSMLVYDDRPLFEEIVETIADCVIASITPALEDGVQFQYALFWEDMCYRKGPLLSPRIFREVLVPHYRRITGLLRRYGVDVVAVDCDGDISQLAPLWLEAGVNAMFPIEVGVWGADPIGYRQQYGRDLLMIGGVSKRILAGPREQIIAEVERLAPLVEEGGYIPLPDHRVPPDVPLSNYLFYLEQARRAWGRSHTSLKPVGGHAQRGPDRSITRFAWHLDA